MKQYHSKSRQQACCNFFKYQQSPCHPGCPQTNRIPNENTDSREIFGNQPMGSNSICRLQNSGKKLISTTYFYPNQSVFCQPIPSQYRHSDDTLCPLLPSLEPPSYLLFFCLNRLTAKGSPHRLILSLYIVIRSNLSLFPAR